MPVTPRTAKPFRHGLLVAALTSASLVFSQGTFQKLFPTLRPTWGDCAQRSHTGGLIFSSSTLDQFDSSGSDIALLSLNNHGDTLWTMAYGTPFNDGCSHLLPTSDGGYLLTGSTQTDGSNDLGARFYLIRTDGVGDTLWTRAYGSGGYSRGAHAVECDDGGFLVVGSWNGAYNDGLYILRIDPQGDMVWTKRYDKFIPPDFESSISVQCVELLPNGDFLFAGDRASFSGVFLARMDPTGELLWARWYDFDYIDQIGCTPDGGVVISGAYDSAPMLMRLDPDGAHLWSKAYQSPAFGWGAVAFTQTSDNGLALVAQTTDTYPGSSNTYFLKTDSAGEVMFSRMFGDTSWDAGRGVSQADDGGYFVVAWTTSFGSSSAMYVIKTDSMGSSGCYEYSDTAVAVDLRITWGALELTSLSSLTNQYPSASSTRRGIPVLPLCPADPVEVDERPTIARPTQVFPNPANDRFTIAIASDDLGSELEIYNAQGERVYRTSGIQQETVIDRSFLTSGIYFIKITNERSSFTGKIVLE